MDENPAGFECIMCGECCKHLSDEYVVILFPQDITRISSRLDMDIASFRQYYVRPDRLIIDDGLWFPIHVIKDLDGRCPFLLDDNRCNIYDFKPIQCARAPFSFFWDSSVHNQFECVRKADVPIDWTSYELDKELVDLIVNKKGEEANTYDEQKVRDSEHCQKSNRE